MTPNEKDSRQEDGKQSGAAAASNLVEEVLSEAVRGRASDLHIESLSGGRMRVRQRIDGVLHEARVLPEGSGESVLARLKAMAGLDTAERRLPQDGRITLQVDGHNYDIRLSLLPTLHGERVTLRILRPESLDLRLEKTGLTAEDLATVRRFCHMPQGIVIVNGPTGCGKTTLLYSMLQEIDQIHDSVMTVEDPVEYAFERISQVQIRPEIGLTFARAIRSMLRQDPDVILVGEIRDRETLEFCVQAAMTGHLILTTLHANTSPAGIRRMLDIGLAPFMLNAALTGLISMRLIRLLCPQCKQPAELDVTTLPPEPRQILRQYGEATWYAPKGCPACSKTGYSGRTAIYEVLVMNDATRQAVLSNAQTAHLRQVAIETGMKTMLEDGLAKAATGATSVEEILRVVPAESYQ